MLRYRGYPIEQIAARSSFLETSYLLIYGELPTQAEYDRWLDDIVHHTLIHEEMRRFFDSFPYDAHPMAVLASGTVGLSTFYQDSHDPFDRVAVELTIRRLMPRSRPRGGPTRRASVSRTSTPGTISTTSGTSCT